MADVALDSKTWIARQNKEREERHKRAREKAREMTEGARKVANLDTGNRVILEAQLKNMELTNEEQRDQEWHEQYDRTQAQLAKIVKNDESDGS